MRQAHLSILFSLEIVGMIRLLEVWYMPLSNDGSSAIVVLRFRLECRRSAARVNKALAGGRNEAAHENEPRSLCLVVLV